MNFITVDLILIVLVVIGMYIVTKIDFLNHQVIRFIMTGGFNTFNYYLLYLVLFQSFNFNYLFAHIIAFLYSAFCSYFVTVKYTFKQNIEIKTLLLFPLTFLPNFLISTFFAIFLVEYISEDFATLIAMILAIPVTYAVNKIIFNKNKEV